MLLLLFFFFLVVLLASCGVLLCGEDVSLWMHAATTEALSLFVWV